MAIARCGEKGAVLFFGQIERSGKLRVQINADPFIPPAVIDTAHGQGIISHGEGMGDFIAVGADQAAAVIVGGSQSNAVLGGLISILRKASSTV